MRVAALLAVLAELGLRAVGIGGERAACVHKRALAVKGAPLPASAIGHCCDALASLEGAAPDAHARAPAIIR